MIGPFKHMELVIVDGEQIIKDLIRVAFHGQPEAIEILTTDDVLRKRDSFMRSFAKVFADMTPPQLAMLAGRIDVMDKAMELLEAILQAELLAQGGATLLTLGDLKRSGQAD